MSRPPIIERRAPRLPAGARPPDAPRASGANAATTGAVSLADLVGMYRAGQFAALAAQAGMILRGLPDTADRLNICGAAFHALSRFAEAEACFREALRLRRSEKLQNNLGNAIRAQGRHREALEHYRTAIEMEPAFAEAHNNMGNALKDLGQPEEALACYDRAIALKPAYEEAVYNKANALQELQRMDEAERLYLSILRRNPRMPQARNNLAKIMLETDRSAEAIEHLTVAAELLPNVSEVFNNLGNALKDLRRLEAAEKNYRLALSMNPALVSAQANLGSVLLALGKYRDAAETFSAVPPDRAAALVARLGRAVALEALQREAEAIAEYRAALEIDPTLSETRSKLMHLSADMCDWSRTDADLAEIVALEEQGKPVFPFAMLPFRDDPELALKRAQTYTREHHAACAPPLAVRRSAGRPQPRLTIGYFSADFREHVIGRLMVRILERHDRSRFRVIAYDLSNTAGSARPDEVRSRTMAAVDAFVPISRLSDDEAVQRARADEVDIAVDLTGYTTGGRVGIMARRAAPVQISYLGFPGTMGAPFYDYMIADRHIIPPQERRFYTENIIYMPGSYLVADDSRPPAAPLATRADLGLAEAGFVFCCFNAAYKINARMMDYWCDILRQVPASQLWLYGKNDIIRGNLRQAAAQRAVDPDRLVFIGAQKYHDYLANCAHADLFLDTFPYNANATANDALHAGVPVLTMAGRNLISRAAAGLLATMGLHDLVTDSPDAYVARAVRIAQSPETAAGLKARLRAAAPASGLFDAARFTRALETGLEAAFSARARGQPPEDILL